MSKEVSCRACAFLLDMGKAKGFSQIALLNGIPYSLEYMQNKHERIEWTVYCRFIKNLRPIFSDDDFVEFGRSWVKSQFFRPWAIIVRLTLNLGKSLPLAQNILENIASQFFAGINFHLEEVGPNGFKITLRMKNEYEFCPEHLLIVKGSLSVIPTLIGYQTAQVTMKWIEQGATFEVTEAKKVKIHSWIYKKIFWLFTARATIKEIIDAHNALIVRYQELENAREKLAQFSQRLIESREQERLRIANELHDDISGNLSSIALLGEALESKRMFSEEDWRRLKEIPRLARITADSMRDIVWFINPENDDMDKLLAKMRETANLMLETIDFRFTGPENDISIETDLDFRRNLYLFYKECLQNIIKHSQATKVEIEILPSKIGLKLKVADNGVGFDTTKEYSGNGLKNLKRRAADMDYKMEIVSGKNNGTEITLACKRE